MTRNENIGKIALPQPSVLKKSRIVMRPARRQQKFAWFPKTDLDREEFMGITEMLAQLFVLVLETFGMVPIKINQTTKRLIW